MPYKYNLNYDGYFGTRGLKYVDLVRKSLKNPWLISYDDAEFLIETAKYVIQRSTSTDSYVYIVGCKGLLCTNKDKTPIKIGVIKFSLTASCTESIGKGRPALTIAALTPFFL